MRRESFGGIVLVAAAVCCLHPSVEASSAAVPPERLPPSPRARPLAERDAESDDVVRARSHLRAAAGRYGLDVADVEGLALRDAHASPGGARIVRFRQRVQNLPIWGREVAVITDAAGVLTGITGRLADSAMLRRAEIVQGRVLRSAEEEAARHGAARDHVHATLYERGGELVPAHQVVLAERGVALVVSAIDGATLQSVKLTHADQFRVFADPNQLTPQSSPAPDAAPHPTAIPSGFEPAFGAPSLVSVQNFPFSRNDRWLPPGAVSLSGNATFAYVDRAGGDGFDPGLDLDVPATGPGTFDYLYDPTAAPGASDTQGRAAAAHAFYVAAFLHDSFYDAGFDESAGNTQASNFGRGGLGGDRLLVEAQDHRLAGRSEALVPPDGITPRISFGIYAGQDGRLARDGAVDTSVVAHEWGHVLAERLVGDGVGLGNTQGRAISEGVADLIALITIVRDHDITAPSNANWNGVFPIGGYAGSARDANGYYYGVRRGPYSSDMTRNGLTLRHVQRGALLPNVPLRASDPWANPQQAGEVWGAALFEFYVGLLRAHPFMEAQDRVERYLVAGLRATPFEPTFLEARDAMRAAIQASDPADAERFSAAMAKRGFGATATPPPRSSTDLIGALDGYGMQGLRVVATSLDDADSSCDADGILDAGERGWLSVTVENVGRSVVSWPTASVLVGAGTPPLELPNGNTLSFPSVQPGARASARVSVRLLSSAAQATAGFRLVFGTNVLTTGNEVAAAFPVHVDELRSASTDTMSTRTSSLAFERDGVRQPFVATQDGTASFAHLEDGPARGTRALVTPPLDVQGALTISYRARWSLVDEPDSGAAIDGAVVEVSEDGVHFVDVSTVGAAPAYIAEIPADNPLGARAAYTGFSPGYPAFASRTLAFGDRYAGKRVVLRFRVGASKANASAYGFDVDDLAVVGATEAPFFAPVDETSDGTTCNRPPTASAGPDRVVRQFEGDPALGVPTVVQLSAQNSFDPDGDALTYTWRQTGGPMAALESTAAASTSFTVPALAADAQLTFEVAVSDGTDTSTASVRIVVRRDNRAPTAQATGPASARSGELRTLDGSQSNDPDGDALTYTWTQVAGPAAALTPDGALLGFVAPVVTTETPIGFTLTVSDGLATSAPVQVDVRVLPPLVEPDGGVDPGPEPVPDGGSGAADAGPSTRPDGGSTPTPGGEEPTPEPTPAGEDGSGGCSVGTTPGAGATWGAWLVGLALVIRRARRRLGGTR